MFKGELKTELREHLEIIYSACVLLTVHQTILTRLTDRLKFMEEHSVIDHEIRQIHEMKIWKGY